MNIKPIVTKIKKERLKMDLTASNDISNENDVSKEGLNGLGGWLIFIIFGFIASIIQNFMSMKSIIELYETGIIKSLLDTQHQNYNVILFFLVNFELVGVAIAIIATIAALVMYFKKKSLFPKFAIGVILYSIIFSVFDIYLLLNLGISSDILAYFVGAIFGGSIKIAYFLKSVRVKNTFIN